MRAWMKVFFIGVVVVLLLFLSAYLLFAFFGKDLLIKQLESATNKKVTVSGFSLTPPLRIEISGLHIEGFLRAQSIVISPSLFRLAFGQVALNRVIVSNPTFFFTRNPESPVQASEQKQPAKAPGLALKTPPLVFKYLEIRDGRLIFTDNTIPNGGLRIVVKDINLKLSNTYSFSGKASEFDLKGKIPWSAGQEEGNIETNGWVNFKKKDMEAVLKIHGIDGIYLYPYYSYWVDLEKARIQKATLNFDANIKGINNDVTAQCRLELANIVRTPRTGEEPEQKAERITNVVLDLFKAMDQGKVVLDFTIKTKMDKPEFGFGNIKMAFESKLSKVHTGFQAKDVVVLPAKLFEGAVRGGQSMTKSLWDGIFAAANEVKKAVMDTFIRPPAKVENKSKASEVTAKAAEEKK